MGWRGIQYGWNNSERKRVKDRGKGSAEDRKKYMDAWAEMMVVIWHEKIARLRVYDTNQFRGTITDNVTSNAREFSAIQHKFMQYGLYHVCGVGLGYEHGNGGHLYFLYPLHSNKEYARTSLSGKLTMG